MRGSILSLAKVVFNVGLVLALISVGFAHNSDRWEPAPEVAAFVAAGGLLSDVCGNHHGHGETHPTECEACRVADGLAVPRGCGAAPATVLEKTRSYQFVAKRLLFSRGLDPARQTRAPPQA